MNSVEFKQVTVRYPLANKQTRSLKEWIVRGPSKRTSRSYFWALRDVTFDVRPGESLAIIGGNGAGKSTLLRVAAGIIVPSSGTSITRGSVAPLIELGTGFDFELTGRENIFFNGALLGRSRSEMVDAVPRIVEFSGLAEFIDSPLRTYSTGMVARLAFAIATSVEADVVLLDEILSVGDAAFRSKCEERIRSFYESGATVVLVSHDLDSIERLAHKALWLHEGRIRAYGDVRRVLDDYRGVRRVRRRDRRKDVRGERLFIDTIEPGSGNAAGGFPIAIHGGGFEDGAIVRIAGRDAQVVERGADFLKLILPALPPGDVAEILVENPSGDAMVEPDGFFADFVDVASSHPHHAAIEALARERLVRSSSESYDPDSAVSRRNVVGLLAALEERGKGVAAAWNGEVGDEQFSSALERWLSEGLGEVRQRWTDAPDESASRGDVATVVLSCRGHFEERDRVDRIFADVAPEDPRAPFIEQFYREHITLGCSDAPLRYCPDDLVSRGQLAAFLARAFTI